MALSRSLTKTKSRIMAAYVILALLPLILLGIFVYTSSRAPIRKEAVNDLKKEGFFVADTLERKLEATVLLGNLFSKRPGLIDAIKKGDAKTVTSHLQSFTQEVPDIDRVTMVNLNGKGIYGCLLTQSSIGRDLSDRDWFKGTKRTKKPYISEFYLTAAKPQKYVFAIGIPILDNGKPLAFMNIVPTDDYIKKTVPPLIIKGTTRVWIVDKRGYLIYNSTFQVDRLIDYSTQPEVKMILEGKEGMREGIDPVSKINELGVYIPVKNIGGGLVIKRSTSEIYQFLHKIGYAFTGVMIIACFLAILGAFVNTRLLSVISERTVDLEQTNKLLNVEIVERNKRELMLGHLAAIVEGSREAIISENLEGMIISWNAAAEETYGYSSEEAIGKPIELLNPESNRQEAHNIFQRAKEGERIPYYETKKQRKGGQLVDVALSMSPVTDKSGNIVGVSTIAHDISEQKRTTEQIKTLNKDLQRHVDELARANKELEAFSYSVSHDLRAPLRHIMGFSELLQENVTNLDEKSRHYLKVIIESVKRMGDLIDDLLSFSRMGRTEIQNRTINTEQLVKDTIGELSNETRGRNIVWNIAPLFNVNGDYAMLRLAFTNLIANAVKFTRKSEQATIDIGYTSSEDNQNVFFIRDNGVGFNMKYVDKLFGVFKRLHAASEFEGTGIGLANVKRIIQRHGGKVWAEGIEGKGATFYISLPNQGGNNYE